MAISNNFEPGKTPPISRGDGAPDLTPEVSVLQADLTEVKKNVGKANDVSSSNGSLFAFFKYYGFTGFGSVCGLSTQTEADTSIYGMAKYIKARIPVSTSKLEADIAALSKKSSTTKLESDIASLALKIESMTTGNPLFSYTEINVSSGDYIAISGGLTLCWSGSDVPMTCVNSAIDKTNFYGVILHVDGFQCTFVSFPIIFEPFYLIDIFDKIRVFKVHKQ